MRVKEVIEKLKELDQDASFEVMIKKENFDIVYTEVVNIYQFPNSSEDEDEKNIVEVHVE